MKDCREGYGVSNYSDAIHYEPGKIPTRHGMTLYSPPGHSVVPPHLHDSFVYEKNKLFSSFPSPHEEYFRHQQMIKLRQKSEEICKRILHIPVPKDLFDRCIFMSKSCKDSSQYTSSSSYQDPIFPPFDTTRLRKILFRELFGDIIGRLIPKNKQDSLTYLIPSVGIIIERSWTWFGFFYKYACDDQNKPFFRHTFPSPLSTFPNFVCNTQFSNQSSHATQCLKSLPPWCPPAWIAWLERTRSLLRDHAAQILRYVDIIETNKSSLEQLEGYLIEQSNIIVRNVLVAIYPIVYVFLSQAADEILHSIQEYQNIMEDYVTCEKKGEESHGEPCIKATYVPSSTHPYDDQMILTYKNDSVSCRRSHFEKYIRLYLWKLGLLKPSLGSATPQEEPTILWPLVDLNLIEKDRDTILERIYVMLKRYSSVIYNPPHQGCGGNMHAAAPETVFHYLQQTFHVETECFASPNNCFFPQFFSAFFDTDQFFGSRGSFFDVNELPSGAYEVGPPYTEEVLLHTINHIERILCHSPPESAVTFFLFVPDWVDCHGVKRMNESRWFTSVIEGQGHRHLYVIGTQHCVSGVARKRYYRPPHNTLCFIFQSDKARQTTAITSQVKQALSLCMTGSPNAEESQRITTHRAKPKFSKAVETKDSNWWTILTMNQDPVTRLIHDVHCQNNQSTRDLSAASLQQDTWRVSNKPSRLDDLPSTHSRRPHPHQKRRIPSLSESWRKP